jgi:hypothetical protein
VRRAEELRTQRQLSAGKRSAFCLKHHLPNEKALDTTRIARSPRSQYSKGENRAQMETAFNRNPRQAR